MCVSTDTRVCVLRPELRLSSLGKVLSTMVFAISTSFFHRPGTLATRRGWLTHLCLPQCWAPYVCRMPDCSAWAQTQVVRCQLSTLLCPCGLCALLVLILWFLFFILLGFWGFFFSKGVWFCFATFLGGGGGRAAVLGFPLRLCPICHLPPSPPIPSGSFSVLVSSFTNAELDWFSVPEYALCFWLSACVCSCKDQEDSCH